MNLSTYFYAVFVLVLIGGVIRIFRMPKDVHKLLALPGEASGFAETLDAIKHLDSLHLGELEYDLGSVGKNWAAKIYRLPSGTKNIKVHWGELSWYVPFTDVNGVIQAIEKLLQGMPVQATEKLDPYDPRRFKRGLAMNASNYLGSLNLIDNRGLPYVFKARSNVFNNLFAARVGMEAPLISVVMHLNEGVKTVLSHSWHFHTGIPVPGSVMTDLLARLKRFERYEK